MTGPAIEGSPSEVVQLLQLLRRSAAEVECVVTGGSMGTAIPDGATVRIRLDGAADAPPGTAVALLLGGDTFSIHRLAWRGRSRRARDFVLTHGDGNVFCDAPQRASALLGAVVAVRTAGAAWHDVPPPQRLRLARRAVTAGFEVLMRSAIELSPRLGMAVKNVLVLAVTPSSGSGRTKRIETVRRHGSPAPGRWRRDEADVMPLAVLYAAKAALFLLFAATALRAGSRRPDTAIRRARAGDLLLLATIVSLLVGVSSREAWPFSAWPMDNGLMPGDFRYLAPVAVDARGREVPVDPRAFEPLNWVDLTSWMARRDTIDVALADSIGPLLLTTLQAARERAADGRDAGRYRRRLGLLAAPNTVIFPAEWVAGSSTLPAQVTRLRVYEYRVDLDGPVQPADQQRRRLVFEYPIR